MAWWRREEREQDLERELRAHLELEAAEQQENGLSPEQARYAARRVLGNSGLLKEEVRETWGGRWWEDFAKDIRLTFRQMRKAPAFTAVAVLSLALGIGGNTAIFTLIDAVLLKSLPVHDPASLVVLGDSHGSGVTGNSQQGPFTLYSVDLYNHLQNTRLFDGLCAFQSSEGSSFSVRRQGWSESQPARTRLVSGNYFEVLGVRAAMGRTIGAADDSASAPLVAVASYRYWRDRLNGDPSIIGSAIDIANVPVSIIGVTPPEFYGETLEPDPPGLWLPISASRQLDRERALVDHPSSHWLYLMGRLAPNLSQAQVQIRLTAALQNWLIAQEGPAISAESRQEISQAYIKLTPGGGGITHMQQTYAATLRLLLGISILVLLITCANIANLLLARGAARRSETSLRLALGASRGRLVRQWLTESLTLALTGGALGLLAATVGTQLLMALFFRGTGHVPIQTAPDLRVLLFTLTLSCAAAIVFGLLPALRVTSQIASTMKGASAGIKGSTLSHRSFGLGAVLIVGEVALSLIVLTGAGSFARSLANLTSQKFGFDRDRVLLVDIDTGSAAGYGKLAALYQQIDSGLNGLPGIKSASLSYYAPFNDCCWSTTSVQVAGAQEPKEEAHTRMNRVSPRYFETLGTRIILGRIFDQHDTAGSPQVAVVTEAFVQHYLPNQNPLGRHVTMGGGRNSANVEIVGVVEDAKYDHPREGRAPMLFLPFLQVTPDTPVSSTHYKSNFADVLEIRTNGRPAAIAAEVRHALAGIDPRLPVMRVTTLSDSVSLTLNQENVIAALALFFGLVALVLSCLGLYGLMAYAVQRRTSEIGIRIALGARRGAVIGMVVREALLQGAAGILLGIPAAYAALRLVANQLYGVSPNDPKYSLGAALVLLLCITIAGYLPALRAARIDPLIALRYE